MCICYRFGTLNAILGRFLLKTGILHYTHFGLPNLMVDERICPEFLQEEVCWEQIGPWLENLWEETPERAKMLDNLRQARANLGESGVLPQLAQRVLQVAQREVSGTVGA